MKARLALLLVAYLALATGYNLATPFGVPPDEGAHAGYLQVLAEKRRLPVLDLRKTTNQADPAGYEAHQPPLYYLLAAPAWNAGRALGGDDRSAAIAARFVSTLIGAGGLILIWLLAGLVVGPARPWVPLAAAGFAAFLPMRLSLCASISNDPLAEAASTGVLCLLVAGLQGGFSRRLALGLGLALGAALMAKATSLLLLPFALAGLAIGSQKAADPAPAKKGRGRTEPAPPAATFDTGEFLLNAGVAFGTVALLVGWWFVRNQVLYGDVLLEQTFRLKFGDALNAAGALEVFRFPNMAAYLVSLVLPMTFQTFWGAFGHLDRADCFMGALPRGLVEVPDALAPLASVLTLGSVPPQPGGYPPASWLYPLLAVWTWAAAIGLARLGWRRRAEASRLMRLTVFFLAAYSLLVLAGFLRFNMEFFQAQGRYLFSALGPLALGFAAGWLAWFPDRRQGWGTGALTALMVTLALYALLGVIVPAF